MSNFEAEAQAAVLEAQIDAVKRSPNYAVFKTGDDEIDAALVNGGMQVASTGSERRTLYNTETGEPVEIPVAFLARTLMKRRNGRPAFATVKPGVVYQMGKVKCLLHPEHPDYHKLREIGLANKVCGGGETPPAGQLASEYDRDQHMAHRHGREWAVIKEYRERMEREEERNLRRQEIAAMREVAESAVRRGPGRPPKAEGD